MYSSLVFLIVATTEVLYFSKFLLYRGWGISSIHLSEIDVTAIIYKVRVVIADGVIIDFSLCFGSKLSEF